MMIGEAVTCAADCPMDRPVDASRGGYEDHPPGGMGKRTRLPVSSTHEKATGNGVPLPMPPKPGRPPMPQLPARSTTILSVRRNGQVALGGDGQVTLGATVVKHDATKIRRVGDGKVLVGFAGSAADAFSLLERFE